MADNQQTAALSSRGSTKCDGCGATLHFEPSTQTLTCEHCGKSSQIAGSDNHLTEGEDYDAFVGRIGTEQAAPGFQSVKCINCGSTSVLDSKETADKCSFCGSPLVLDLTANANYVSPHYVLPFRVNQEAARKQFMAWLKSLSFAPSDLTSKVSGSSSPVDGVYLPYFLYDADATTSYTGERGDYYYTTEYYYEEVDGEQVQRSREVRHTAWSPAFGTVFNDFTNIVTATSSSVNPDTLHAIGNFDLGMMVQYDEKYITGFRAETFTLNPQQGLDEAKNAMGPAINQTIMADIGGDEQRIFDSSTELSEVKIKYALLPIWISSYQYENKTYQFAINGYTGTVAGKRPWSAWKIIRLILIIMAVIAMIVYFVNANNS